MDSLTTTMYVEWRETDLYNIHRMCLAGYLTVMGCICSGQCGLTFKVGDLMWTKCSIRKGKRIKAGYTTRGAEIPGNHRFGRFHV